MSSTNRRGRGRSRSSSNHHSRKHHRNIHRNSKVSSSNIPEVDTALNRLSNFDEQRNTYPWNGREYAIGGHRITTTKTTKTTKTAHGSDGSVHVLPGSTHVTTISNSTLYTSQIPSEHSDNNQFSFVSSSSSTSSGKKSNQRNSHSAIYWENYFNENEDMVYDYDGKLDAEFARGVQLSPEDQMHPFELQNTGGSSGILL